MTLVRGRSSNPDLAKLGHLIHVALFALLAQGYWEEQETLGRRH